MYIAKVIRAAMEDFHVKSLSADQNDHDDQMKILNPIIRNAVATALYAAEQYDVNPLARDFVNTLYRSMPTCWEQPELSRDFSRDGFLKLLESGLQKSNYPADELGRLAKSILENID